MKRVSISSLRVLGFLAMFDWNDEELTNIIWGEAGESDDHIVPYPESSEVYCKKKEWVQSSGTIKSTEQKAPGLGANTNGRKLGGSSSFDAGVGTASEFRMDLWPNLSLSNVAKADQDSLGNSVSDNLTEITKIDPSAEATKVDKGSGILQNPNGGKDQGNFVDYCWDGSFDELDQILSNDDPIFGDVNLGNPDQLWSSSKELTASPVNSFVDSPSFGFGALRDASENFEIKAEYLNDEQAFTLGYGKENDRTSHMESAYAVSVPSDYAGSGSMLIMKEQKDNTIVEKETLSHFRLTTENAAGQGTLSDKAYKQSKPLKGRKKYGGKEQPKLQQEFYGNWSSSAEPSVSARTQFARPIQSSSSSVVSQQRQLHGTDPSLYQHFCDPFVHPATYGNIANSYSAMPVMSHIQLGEQRPLLSGFEVSSDKANPIHRPSDSPRQLQNMTPQEKIEKLRRRQQMQAMLAIQKQQQQLGHQVSYSDPAITQCSQESQIPHIGRANLDAEDLSNPTFDNNSPIEQDDSNMTSLAIHDYSAQDAILYHLQDVVAKLDVRVRLCMRNSLFRLAQSATQRHFACDTSSTNKSSRNDQGVSKEEHHQRDVKMPEVETETNPVDRTVAHLLFHRPVELSGKHLNTPESPASAKMPNEHNTVGMAKLPMVCSPRNLEDRPALSLRGSRSSSMLCDPQLLSQGKTSLCVDTSENASNVGSADHENMEVEASQHKDEPLSST